MRGGEKEGERVRERQRERSRERERARGGEAYPLLTHPGLHVATMRGEDSGGDEQERRFAHRGGRVYPWAWVPQPR